MSALLGPVRSRLNLTFPSAERRGRSGWENNRPLKLLVFCSLFFENGIGGGNEIITANGREGTRMGGAFVERRRFDRHSSDRG